jgi:hypothetical protein
MIRPFHKEAEKKDAVKTIGGTAEKSRGIRRKNRKMPPASSIFRLHFSSITPVLPHIIRKFLK